MPSNWKYTWIFCYFTLINAQQDNNVIPVNKCCEPYELYVDSSCTHVNLTNETVWHPMFTSESGVSNVDVEFRQVIGLPDCGSTQQWPVYYYQNSLDRLILLPNGKLRHYIHHDAPDEMHDIDMMEPLEEEAGSPRYYDHEPGKYCMEKRLNSEDKTISLFAWICAPEVQNVWTNTDFIMRKLVDPIFHGMSIACYLFVAIIYFIIPTLRDLVGNIVTTITLCLIASQAADLVRIFTEFSSHVSFIVADIVCYVFLLAAFFWLNSLGYYIWKTFKSRNVFLRITDGRKYCYYSSYAWSCTIVMGALAIFAHFMLEIPKSKSLIHNQEVLGPLGMAMFFTPIAFTILVNVFFYATTLQILNRMHTYGRIHHKLRHSFRMFLLLFLVMTITWLFMVMSWLNYDSLYYCYIVVNALQAPIFVYICVFNQKHVAHLMRKTCCYTHCICACCRPEPELEWGDEMTAMNTGIY